MAESKTLSKPGAAGEKADAAAGTVTEQTYYSYEYEKLDRPPHHSFAFETHLFDHVAEGDDEGLLRQLDEFDLETLGQMAHTRQKSMEYFSVLLISFAARGAIRGGVDPYDAYALNDLYLQQVSVCQTESGYMPIIREAVRAFCRMVRQARQQNTSSLLTSRCKSYIVRHLNRDLSLHTLADVMQVSPAYLSHTFSVHEKQTLHSYILQERLRAACNMLRFSDYTISGISTYLGFASQSYFGSVFRREQGCSPSEYRRRNHKMNF